MPAGPLLIDTDVISYWIAGAQEGADFLSLVGAREQAISFATYGELLANAHRNRWGERRLKDLHSRLRSFTVLPYNEAVVELWARMHAKLSGHLHRGGANDMWTAACALTMQPQLPVVTNNRKDFETIAAAFSDLRIVHPNL